MAPVTWEHVARLEAALAAEIPGFRVAYKNASRLHRAIGRLLRPVNPGYLTDYTTVLGRVVYFPSRQWRERAGPEAVYATLRHEAVHLRDMRRFPVLFQVSYVFLLPAILTFRSLWEYRAYRETLRVHAELRGAIPDALLEHIVRRFTGPDYLFMAPFPPLVRWLLRRTRRRILEGRI